MNKYTKGPWTVADRTHVYNDDLDFLADLDHAAPELLEALQILVTRVKRGWDGLPQGEGLRLAEAAIAKAEGKL